MEYQLAELNIALHTLDKAKAYEFVYQTIHDLALGKRKQNAKNLAKQKPP